MDDRAVGAIVISVVLGIFWCYQFIKLMLLTDADFPSKHDKILWAVGFFVLPPLAPFAFLFWMRAYLEMRDAQRTINDKK
jgi:hypothetical protein